jgi:hypothetical protein
LGKNITDLRSVKSCATIFFVPGTDSLSADQLREQLKADVCMADLDLFEDLADLHDTEGSAKLRVEFANRYRKILGVNPPQRHKFKEGLQGILDGNGKFIADVISEIEPPA